MLDVNNISKLLHNTGMKELRLLTQVHGKDIIRTTDKRSIPEGDGWFGKGTPGTLYGIKTADCLPLLLFDPEKRNIAALHCGWRSALAGIVPSALELFRTSGSAINGLIGAVGPAIGPCCFEVGAEFENMVSSEYLTPAAGNKFHLDLRLLVRTQLLDGGAELSGIENIERCTLCSGEDFFSHRRSGEGARMCSFIGLSSE